MASEEEEEEKPVLAKSSFSLSRRVVTRHNNKKKSASVAVKQRSSPRRLPIPSFADDPELVRLEKEFFDSEDEKADVKPPPAEKEAAAKPPVPDVACLDDVSSDGDEDDLLAPTVFSKKNKVAEASPPLKVLERAVDHAFSNCDLQQCTIKQILATLENQLCVVLTREAKVLVRQRLKDLVSGRVSPSTTSLVAALSNKSDAQVPTRRNEAALKRTEAPANDREVPSTKSDNGTKEVSDSQLYMVECVEYADDLAVHNVDPSSSERKLASSKAAPKARATSVRATKSAATKKAPPVKSVDTLNETAPQVNDARKKRTRSRRTAVNETSVPQDDSIVVNPPTKASLKATTTRGRKRGRGTCQLCSNCPCTSNINYDGDDRVVAMDLAKSDAAVEKNLMKLLQKLEMVTEQYEDQTDAVRRRLKKHRRDMWKKREEIESTQGRARSAASSRFLPDVQELDQQLSGVSDKEPLSVAAVQKARSNMFSFAPNFQPTLTQMFGSSRGENNGGNDGPLETVNEEEVEQGGAKVIDMMEAPAPDGSPAHEPQGSIDSSVAEEESEDESDEESTSLIGCDAHRLEWENGVEKDDPLSSPVMSGPSIWRSLLTGTLDCAWDRLFNEDEQDDDIGMEHLLGMFEQAPTTDSKSEPSDTRAQSPIDMSMLSQRGQLLAKDILGRIRADTDKLAKLEAACPNWQENILFALRQRELEDVQGALDSVRASREKLERAKQNMLDAFRRQETALGVFEDALVQSASRLEGSTSQDVVHEGFFQSQAAPTPGAEEQPSGGVEEVDSTELSSAESLRDDHADATDTAPALALFSEDQPANALEEDEKDPNELSTPQRCGRGELLEAATTPLSVTSHDTILAS